MYLLDTNIFLELLLEQQKAESVRRFLTTIELNDLFMSDFTLHSIGIVLFRLGKHTHFQKFVDDTLIKGGIRVLTLTPEQAPHIITQAEKFGLDFDDAYQYAIGETLNLQLVSFDGDFDKTERGRKEPSEILL